MNRMSSNQKIRRLGTAVLALVMLAGCGGDDGFSEKEDTRNLVDFVYDEGKDQTYIIRNGQALDEVLPGKTSYVTSFFTGSVRVFMGEDTGKLYLLRNGTLEEVAEHPMDYQLSSESTMLAWVTAGGELYLRPVTGGEPRLITDGFTESGDYALSPNGNCLLYTKSHSEPLTLYSPVGSVSWGTGMAPISVSDDGETIYASNNEGLCFCQQDGTYRVSDISAGGYSNNRMVPYDASKSENYAYTNRDHTELILANDEVVSLVHDGNLFRVGSLEDASGQFEPQVRTRAWAHGNVRCCDTETFLDGFVWAYNYNYDSYMFRITAEEQENGEMEYFSERYEATEIFDFFPDTHELRFQWKGVMYRQDMSFYGENAEGETVRLNPKPFNMKKVEILAENVYNWVEEDEAGLYYVDRDDNLLYLDWETREITDIAEDYYGSTRLENGKVLVVCRERYDAPSTYWMVTPTEKTEVELPENVNTSDLHWSANALYRVENEDGTFLLYSIISGTPTLVLNSAEK